jgi:hypothetical protein
MLLTLYRRFTRCDATTVDLPRGGLVVNLAIFKFDYAHVRVRATLQAMNAFKASIISGRQRRHRKARREHHLPVPQRRDQFVHVMAVGRDEEA